MAWTERQTALLAAMGLRVWLVRPAAVVVDPAQVADDLAPAVAALAAAPPPDATVLPPPGVIASPLPGPARPPTGAVVTPPAAAVMPSHAAVPPPQVDGSATGTADWLVVTDLADARASRLVDAMLHALALSRNAGAEPQRRAAIVAVADAAALLDASRPRVALALGIGAARALLGGDEPLGRLRGRVHDRRGVPVVVSYEPGYLLRNRLDKARAWDDLCLAADTAEDVRASSSAASTPAA